MRWKRWDDIGEGFSEGKDVGITGGIRKAEGKEDGMDQV